MIIDPSPDHIMISPTNQEALPDYVTVLRSQPPRYSQPSRPPQPLTYTFTDWTSNSLLLLPPQTSADLSPLYHISVTLNLNPFVPISYVTTVRRGGNDQGAFVGEFELSLNQKRAILTIGDTTARLTNVLSRINGSSRHWTWNCGHANLRWDCRSSLDDGSPMCICYVADSSMTQLASFVPPPFDASPPLPAAVLTVFPDGHEFFDHILVSALVVERKRTLDF